MKINDISAHFISYISITGISVAEYKVKRSYFISNAKHIASSKEAREFITGISKKFKDANHNCWAYKTGAEEFSSDDGEPHESAGLPILRTVNASGLDMIVIVVTRYFGGIKLGLRGLIDAYSYAAKLAIESATRERFIKGMVAQIDVDYENYDRMRYIFKKSGYLYAEPPAFDQKIRVKIFIPTDENLEASYIRMGKLEIKESEIEKFLI